MSRVIRDGGGDVLRGYLDVDDACLAIKLVMDK